jgi:superfamily II DNA or RNA helicase
MEEFAPMKTGVIHTAKSLDEGADVPGLDLAIILCNTSSQTQKTQRLGRVIRYEEGKEAEVFTLVIKGTMEESWHSTSTAGKNYIEITEDELTDILNGGTTDNIVREGKQMDSLFRF